MSTARKMKVLGEVLESKKGTFYIKIKTDANLELKEGDAIFLTDPREELKRLIELGYVDAEEGNKRIAMIKDFVKYTIKIPA